MDEIQKLYDALSKRGYYTKSFDDFKVQFQDKAYQDKVYNVVSRDGLYTKSKDEFLSKYSVSPQKDTFKKKEDSEVVLEAGGEAGTSEPPLRKEKVLDYLASLKTPPVVTGKAPIIPKEKAILPVQKPKKIDTSFGLTKEKIKVDISPKVEEISFDADPIGLAQRKASETKNLQEATDYLSAAEVFKQLSVPSGYQAYVRSASPLVDKSTATGSVILERAGRYGATTEGLRQIKAPDLSTANEEFIKQEIIPQIERAAVIYKVRANPSFEKELKAVNTSVDDPNLRSVLGSAKMGSIMEEFLNNPDVASFAREENPNLSIALQYARDKNFDLNKEWGISSVANKVSREFERSEKRGGAFAPFATESLKKDIDEVAKQKLNPEEYGIYQTYIKGNEEQYLDTPSFLGGVAEGGKGVFEGILNTIEKVTGFAPPKEDVIRNKWREEAMNVSANPEGLRNIVAESGKVAGLVGALFGTGGLIRGGLGIPAAGTGLPATTLTNIADATNVATAFLGDMIDEGVVKYPTEPVKAYTSAIFNTLVFMAMGKDIFPGAKVKSAFSKVQPEVEQVVKNLANGSISREAARQELNTIGKKAIDIAAAGVSQNAKVSAELTGLSVLNEGLDILMDMDEDKLRKYYPEGVHGDTFKTMFLSNALVSSIAGYGKVKRDNTIARESIYEAASNPKRYSRIIEDLVIKDPNITKEELLNNLSFAVETKRLLDQRGIPVESQKQYLVKALGERVAIAEKEKIADSTLRKEAEDKIKQAQAEKEAILTAPEEAPEMVGVGEVAPEVAPEAKPQIYEFEGKRYEVTDRSVTEVETGNLLPVSKIDKIRKEGKLIEEVEEAPQVPAAPEIETKRADIERRRQEELSALIPQQKQAKGKLDFSAAFSGWLGRDLYEKVFNALQKGETTVAGIKEPLIGEAKPYFEKGLIKSAEDVFKYVNGKDINAKYDAELAALGVGEVALEAAPSYLQNVRQTEAEGFYKADFGRNGGLTWEIPESQREKDSPEYLIIQSIDRNKDTGEAPKEDSKGEGAKAIADLFNKYPSVNEIVYDDYSQSGFWQKIGGDNQSLKREDFFKYYNSKFPKEAEIPATQIAENFKKDFNEGKLERGKEYGGGRNLGVYDYEGGIVKVVKEKRRLGEDQLTLMRERLGDMDNVYIPKAEVDLGKKKSAIVMDKATGVDASTLTKEQIDAIPQEHWDKFEADIRELSKRGVAVDLTKRDNFFYDKDKGFSFIDISGISINGEPTAKFFMKDGVEYYYKFEQYPFSPKKFEGGKKMFENIPEIKKEEVAPEVPAAPEMEDMPELPTEIPPSGFRPVEGIEEFEVVGPKKEAPETKEETDLRKRALNLDVEGNIRGEVLQYFIGGGTVNPEAIKRLFQRKDNNIRWNNMKPEERKTRIGFMKKGSPNIEALAEKLAGADRLDITQDFRNAIEDVLLGSGGKRDMAKELVESYDAEYKMMMRDKELTELGEEMEKQIQEFTAGLPEAQKKEIIKVLDEFRFEDGTIDWNRIEKEIEAIDPFSPEIILRLSPETQKTIQNGIKQIKETGRVSRVPVEAAPSPETLRETRAAEATDKRTEAKNQLRDAFNDLMNLGVAYDPRSQAEKQVRLTKAIINVIKQEAIGAIKDLQKYIKDNLGFDISDKDAKYLLIESKKPEYAIQEPTAGEVPVQPEARVGEEVAAGVPPTEPPKVTPEGEAPREERKKAILGKIIDSPSTPESLKEEVRKKGLSYTPAKQAEATRLANAIIDAVGIDQAVEMASKGEFSDTFGGMNTAVLTEAAARLTNDPVKQAQIFDILDVSTRSKGQDISYLQEFYTKNPLGVVIYQNAQRKESFREWSAQKDKSWQEALDVLKAEVEQLKKELTELRARPEAEGVKTAKAKAAAARQKRAFLIEKYKKNRGGGLTLSAGGLTKEGIEFVGEVAVTYIQEGIANVEVLVQKVLADIKDVMGRDIPELRDQIETITRESFQKRKGQSVIDRIRKKLDGLSNKEKEEVIRKSYKKILDSGGLDFQDFKDIIADVLGRGPLTEEQANKLKQLTKTVNDLEVKSLEAQEKRTPQALAEYEKAQKEAAIARRELDRLFNSKPDLMRTITSLMQLNTLGVVSLVANVTYNVANQSLLRFPVGVINSLLDRSVSGVARLTGKRLNPETNILSRQVQREFFSKMALGFKEAGEQLYTGLNRQDYIQREVYGGQIRPLESMKNLYSFLKGEKKMSLANFVDNTLQATVGVPAEAVARLLSVGDKPFRYAAEGAMAAQISKALGIKGLDYDLFVKFPKAEAYRIYKSQGFSEAEALQKAEIVEKSIIQEGKRSTFQQENFLNDKLSQLFNDTQSGAGAFVKSLTISPYVKIPSNAFWSNFNLLHPEVSMLQMFLLGDKARKLQEKDPVAAKMARREARYWFSHAVVGFSYLSAITSMVAAGVFTPGVTAEETKKEREGKQYYGKPGTINVMKLMAWLRGEDPTKVKEGYDVQIKWFGHIGYLGNAIARRELDLTEEQRNNRLQFTEFLLSNLTDDALEGLQSGVFSNTSALINALQSDFFLKRYGLNVLGMLTNVIHPASLAQLSRNELPYYSSTKADSFMDEVKNSFMQRSTWVRDLMGVDQKAKEIEKRRNRELSYSATEQEKIKIRSKYDAELFSLQTAKVGIWGDKLEKKDNFMMRWFGISKSNPDNFAQPLYDIVKRTNNISYFPPTIKPEIEDQGKKTDLNVKQTMELEMLVGQYRKNLVAPLLNDSVEIEGYGLWSEIEDNLKSQGLTDEEARVKADDIKLDAIKRAYEIGFEFGKEAFLDEHPEFRNEDYNKSEIQRRKNTMEKLGKELKKQF